MSPPRFPLRAAAALFIERQHLDRPRGRRFTAASVERFVRDAGGLQLDSINVIERAHYLTAWSRFGPYDKAALDRIAYRRRLLFEYWAHAACLISIHDFPHWRRAMADYHVRSRGWSAFLKKHRRTLAEVRAALATDGPLGSSYFEHKRKPGAAGWWNWKPAAHALDYLWMTGETLIHSRPNFQKRFDLAARVLPDALAAEPPSREEFLRWHMRRSLRAMGAATETDLRMYLTFPRGPYAERRDVLKGLLKSGDVVEVAIETEGRTAKKQRWLALAEDLPSLERAARRRAPSRGTTLLSPFDSFLWHRDRTRRLFGYEYTIEVYVPGPKRVHGYYVLPILHDGRLIGRADVKNHRAERRLEAKRVHFEPWFANGAAAPAADWGDLDRDAAMSGVAESLRSLATFVGAERVTLGAVEPRKLAAPLKRALATPMVQSPAAVDTAEDAEPAIP